MNKIILAILIAFISSTAYSDHHEEPENPPETEASEDIASDEGCAFTTAGLCLTAAAGIISHEDAEGEADTNFRVVAVLHGPIKAKGQKQLGFMIAPGENDIVDAAGIGMAWGFSEPTSDNDGILTLNAGVLAKFNVKDEAGETETKPGIYILLSQSF